MSRSRLITPWNVPWRAQHPAGRSMGLPMGCRSDNIHLMGHIMVHHRGCNTSHVLSHESSHEIAHTSVGIIRQLGCSSSGGTSHMGKPNRTSCGIPMGGRSYHGISHETINPMPMGGVSSQRASRWTPTHPMGLSMGCPVGRPIR